MITKDAIFNYPVKYDSTKKIDSVNMKQFVNLLGKKYTFEIISLLMQENIQRFHEIVKKIGGNAKTINLRLNELVKLNLINRVFYEEIPPRVEYSLSKDNPKLSEYLDVLKKWVSRWNAVFMLA
jgi:DNA-binding HxlR family transcriptional regulator